MTQGFNDRWKEIVEIWRARENQWLYALIGFLSGCLFIPFLSSQSDFLGNLFPEALGILFTIMIIDRFNEDRQIRDRKEQLIVQMSSTDNGIARAAKREMRRKGWLTDGTLVGAELNDANLAGADLSNANLSKVNLSRANIKGATFNYDTVLTQTDFSNADLQGVVIRGFNENLLTHTILSKHDNYHGDIEPDKAANLSGIYMPYRSNFQGMYLQKVIFKDASLKHANFKDADLKNVDFSRADLQGANFQNAHLENANLEGANLTRADFTNAHLGNAKLKNANLIEAVLNPKIMFDIDKYPDIDLEGVILPNGDVWIKGYDMATTFGIHDWDLPSKVSADQCHFCGSYSVDYINSNDSDELICYQCNKRWYLP